MTFLIRHFVTSDQPALIETINTVCTEGRWMSTLRFEPTPAWAHALEEPVCISHFLLIVEDVDGIVGWCRTFLESYQGAETVASLGIGLLPAYRNQGIGTSLVESSLAWAVGAGLRRATLTTHQDNARAIHVFTKCGFSFTDQAYNGMVGMVRDLSVAFDAGKIGTYNIWGAPRVLSCQGESVCEYAI